MSETLSKETSARSGRIRIGDHPKHLATRLERGEIVVISGADLNRESVAALTATGLIAVLSAQPSLTGYVAALGPRFILKAGTALVDDLGQDIMPLREGQEVTVTGSKVLVDGCVIAAGSIVSLDDLDVDVANSSALFAAVDASIEDYLSKDGAMMLYGINVPQLSDLEKQPILLVTGAADAKAELRALTRRRSEVSPSVIAVDGGTDVALNARLSLDLVAGDAELISEKAIRKARSFIVRAGGDGLAPGVDRLDRMGVVYDRVAMAGTSPDAALVVAAHSSAPAVVTAGVSYGEAELVGAGRALVAPAFFSRPTVGSRLIGVQAVMAIFCLRPCGWTLVLPAVVALALIGVALWSAPWGNDLLHPITSFPVSLIYFAGGAQ